MLNKKLFKKLNEQMELNSILDEEITESEKEEIERKVIFENANAERIETLNIRENNE